ncbi:hypothetical protein ARMGADRAFT_180970 [Armillaria gallica]|uniref:Uncharacterized protein n=1 Tax=Armillaria gallica TaxID=47427 RepID=A0A2H3DV93_ARMGA|nr:hypothetical protein ARMGADRAFT_180970 [Armillaria gallica]
MLSMTPTLVTAYMRQNFLFLSARCPISVSFFLLPISFSVNISSKLDYANHVITPFLSTSTKFVK